MSESGKDAIRLLKELRVRLLADKPTSEGGGLTEDSRVECGQIVRDVIALLEGRS